MSAALAVQTYQSTRIGILGGPRTGKSSLARRLSAETGAPILCTDPASLVKEPERGVEYVPDSYTDWSAASAYVATAFLSRPGPWILDGVGLARALRKYHLSDPIKPPPLDRLIVLRSPFVALLPGQASMTKGVYAVLTEIEYWLARVPTEWR